MYYVGDGINTALPHHQILLRELADQTIVCIHNRQITDVVVADHLIGLLQRGIGLTVSTGWVIRSDTVSCRTMIKVQPLKI